MPLLELSRADGAHLSRGRGERADQTLRNPMESASPALSIRATASRNKQNKHPGLGQAGKGRLTHSPELHPLLRCFVWRFKTVGVGARPCLTTILLPQFSPEYRPMQWVFVCFLLGLGKRGVGWEWETSHPALMRQSGVRQAKLWQKSFLWSDLNPSCCSPHWSFLLTSSLNMGTSAQYLRWEE